MARNTYRQDEQLEEPFNIRHLLRASVYIKKYLKYMLTALILSGIGGAFGYLAPFITRRALDVAVPNRDRQMLYTLVLLLALVYIVSVIFTTIRI